MNDGVLTPAFLQAACAKAQTEEQQQEDNNGGGE